MRSAGAAAVRRGRLAAVVQLLLVVLVTVATACSSSARDTILQDKDFAAVEKSVAKFDRNDLMDVPTLTDSEAFDATRLQRFFARTPYDRGTFLETYQSNGIRAADAVLRAGRTYKINPLVLVVLLQVEGGRVGEQNYPLPPERVEYVFRCGCFSPGNCLPPLAGLDRQLECVAKELRTSLETVASSGQTAGGWGTDKTSTTLDSLKVTPANASTAALYHRIPAVRVDEDQGTWVFWNVWTRYAQFLEYGGPLGNGGANSKNLGDACVGDGECGEGNTCSPAPAYPGGYCTRSCQGDCPNAPDRPEAFCASFPEGGFCFAVCNPGAPACPDGYRCENEKRFG